MDSTIQTRGAFSEGIGLVWRRQRLVWWVFVVALFIGSFAAHDITSRLRPMLDESALAQPLLVHSFHIDKIIELDMKPAEYLDAGSTPLHYSLIFFFFLLLATGGILESYWRDATLSTGEFFQSGGTYFWRFLRLVGFLILCLIPVMILYFILGKISDGIDDKSISPFPGVWAKAISILIILFLMMVLRLWFDMAEVIAVAEGEVRSRRCLARSAALLRKHFGSLFWLYFRISFLAWLLFFVGLFFLVHGVHHSSVRFGLVVMQILVLYWIWARLWQRASETVWYKRYLISLP